TTLATTIAHTYLNGTNPTNPHTHTTPHTHTHTHLPTYPFQHQRHWLNPTRKATTGTHPLVPTTVHLSTGDTVHTGKLGAREYPWLAEHTVNGTPLVPATALLDLAMRACRTVEELTHEAPFVVDETAEAEVEVTVDGDTVAIHARHGEDWTRHATGRLSDRAVEVAPPVWPPDAPELDIQDAYPELAERGLDYGPSFQGLRRAWRRDGDRFAEVELPVPNDGFDIHPALFDAALHVLALTGDGTTGQVVVPFAWRGVRLFRPAGTTLRVHIDSSNRITICNPDGEPVLVVEELVTRPATFATDHLRSLHRLDWAELPVRPAGDPPEDVLTVSGNTRETTAGVLAAVQEWIAADHGRTLTVVTCRAVAALPGEDVPHLWQAPVWGLVRTARTEHPGRFVLVDTDGTPASQEILSAAIATGEEEVALREGRVLRPRVVRTAPEPGEVDFGTGPVLVTGAGGVLGQRLARHMVADHGVRDLLLVGRRDMPHPLLTELTASGARVRTAVCDIADRAAVAALLDEHRPTAVVHAAAVLDDATVTELSPERLDAVWRSKVDGAMHLHELAGDLSAFILFSSVAGTIGNAGQANYAAANTFLDALAGHRQATGRPATALVWGLWSGEGLGATLSETDRARMARLGIVPMSAETGLTLFDAAAGSGAAVLIPVTLNAGAEAPPPVLGEVVRTRARQSRPLSWTHTLTGRDPEERQALSLDLVRRTITEVLGIHGTIDAERGLMDLGFDSLTALELRERLVSATGMQLASTLVFDHPTPAALARHLSSEPEKRPDPIAAHDGVFRALEQLVVDAAGETRTAVAKRLRGVLDALREPDTTDLATAADEEIFELLDRELRP
ncbi:type I polyketide synthase, partial [Streptomyces sp. NPDC098090]|uniref:type I polyketide synthase n=2 Tax=unclassified Streptomyces TaxID=2593676 RepID=UPI0038176E4E